MYTPKTQLHSCSSMVDSTRNLLSSPLQACCLTSLPRIKDFQSLHMLYKHADFQLLVCLYSFLFRLRDLGRQFSSILFTSFKFRFFFSSAVKVLCFFIDDVSGFSNHYWKQCIEAPFSYFRTIYLF